MKTIFYPTITGVTGKQLDKVKEANELGLDKLCVFFTTLVPEERVKFYQILEKSIIKEIPFAHIRGDFTKEEIYYLKNTFNTTIFNFHSNRQHKIFYDLEELKREIYIENTLTKLEASEIKEYAGICLDVSHLESDRLFKSYRFEYFQKLIKKIPVGCGHASAIRKKTTYCPAAEKDTYAVHVFDELSEFDYLLNYKDILPPVVALEVENSLREQLEAIKYINNLLKI